MFVGGRKLLVKSSGFVKIFAMVVSSTRSPYNNFFLSLSIHLARVICSFDIGFFGRVDLGAGVWAFEFEVYQDLGEVPQDSKGPPVSPLLMFAPLVYGQLPRISYPLSKQTASKI